jgi:hypothetical protein
MFHSLSKRISGRSPKKEKRSQKQIAAPPIVDKSVQLYDKPVPTTRQMTTSDLFQTSQMTSTQATAMDRTLYEIPQPNKVDAMTDLIKDHQEGDFFPYVGVVGSEGESSDARRARMLALKPSYNKRDVPEIKVLGCPLISREGAFSMDTLMDFAQTNIDPIPVGNFPMPSGEHSANYTMSKPFAHIRQITALFTPNVSSTANYCNLWMNLVDNRLIDSDKGSQTNVVVSNQESIMETSCDYCIPRKDLSSFSLSYTLERDIVKPGHQWGTVSFYFNLTESDLPYQASKVDAMAVYRMPITTLMERETNADKSDISFTPADIVRLRQLFKQGDIVDVDQPQTARLKTNTYSKSSIRTGPKGKEIDVGGKAGWEFMSGSRVQKVDAGVASVDPSDDSTVPVEEKDQNEIDRERQAVLEKWKRVQELEREVAEGKGKEVMRPESSKIESSKENQSVDGEDFEALFKNSAKKKQVRMSVSEV